MSNFKVAVETLDGTEVGVCLYQGSADVMHPQIYQRGEEHPRERSWNCGCGKEPSAVVFRSEFGTGSGTACLGCMVVVDDGLGELHELSEGYD